MRKVIEVAALGAVLLATSPPAHADPTDFSGQMVVIPVRNGQVSGAGTGAYSVHLHSVDPGFSIMTASNGCTQEWHGMDMQVGTGFARQATLPGGSRPCVSVEPHHLDRRPGLPEQQKARCHRQAAERQDTRGRHGPRDTRRHLGSGLR
jgi:hypothetical protein